MRFSAPGIEIDDGSDWVVRDSSLGGWVRAGGRVDQARRSELATRTRWKIAEVFLAVAVGWDGSSAQRFWMSLKEENENGEVGDDVSWIWTVDLLHGRHIWGLGFRVWFPEDPDNKIETLWIGQHRNVEIWIGFPLFFVLQLISVSGSCFA